MIKKLFFSTTFICCISFYSHAELVCDFTGNSDYVSCYNQQTKEQGVYLKSDVEAHIQRQKDIQSVLKEMDRELNQQQHQLEQEFRQQESKMQQDIQRYHYE